MQEIVETMVQAYSQKIFNGQKPVFDGRKNMYSRDPLPIGRDKVSKAKDSLPIGQDMVIIAKTLPIGRDKVSIA